ncbi:MAG: hypothetical protein HC876_17180 [Chloroflexaceae bacterium]|nr:hypothetical protein [Chloroflexaceae bacterium]
MPGRMLLVQNGTIWLWDGPEPRPLIGENAWQPAWSPDGSRIAYIEHGESYSDIMVATASGETLERLTINSSDYPSRSHERIYDTMWAFYPTWSPDGDTLVMIGQEGPPFGSPAIEYNLSIYQVPVEGGSRALLATNAEAHAGQLAYAPDGSMIVFTQANIRQDGQHQLYRLLVDEGTVEPFPGAPPRSYDATFSADGRWLAFAARDERGTDIWVLPARPAAGNNPRPQRLTTMGTARAPIFSPDGTKLAFLAIPPGEVGFELWMVDLTQENQGAIQASAARQLTARMSLDADSGLSWVR